MDRETSATAALAFPGRSVGEIRKVGNGLKDEPSLYLRQHAHNPLDWQPWNAATLAAAQSLHRPIFLSIGYASCHWCHVMEHEVFDQDDIASFMNEHFICVKVDREERPDLDAVYMEATVAMTGGGGWPMSVFLTPDLRPFFAGTYFPKARFAALVERIAEMWAEAPGFVDKQAGELADHLRAPLATGGRNDDNPDDELLEKAARAGLAAYDPRYGGNRSPMKFPTPPRWRFLLHRWRKTGDEGLARAVRHTLDAMAGGGIRDHLGGGFHRYTVDPHWTVPHFEKMLYDNAQLAALYTEAAQAFGEPRYRAVAEDTLDFLLKEMSDPDTGLFFASFDADSGGHEGSFYVFTPAQLTEIAGDVDGPILAALLGVTETGNFEGANVLTRRADPEEITRRWGLSTTEQEALWTRYRPALGAARAQRTAPGLDRKAVTAWNALAITAFAEAGFAFRRPNYIAAATKAAESLWNRHRNASTGHLVRASTDEKPAGVAVLDDYAFLAVALFALHAAEGSLHWLERAVDLTDAILDRFRADHGGFTLVARDEFAPLGPREDISDNVEPSGVSQALRALRLAHGATGLSRHREALRTALAHYTAPMHAARMEMAASLAEAQLYLGPTWEVVICGAPGPDLDALLNVCAGVPHAQVLRLPPHGLPQALESRFPALAHKLALARKPTAYPCQGGTCRRPTAVPEELTRGLAEGWAATASPLG